MGGSRDRTVAAGLTAAREIRAALFVARRYWPLWLAVLPLTAWAFVRAVGLEGASALAPFIAFTPYAPIAALLVLGVCIALRNWVASAVMATAFVALATAVLPRAFGGGEAVPRGSTRLTVLSANLYHGRADPTALLAIVDRLKPDLLNLQELNRSFAVKLHRLGVERRFPQSVVSIQRGVTGAGIFSRYPLTPGPSSRFGPRMLRAEIEMPGGRRVRVVDVHPFTPAGSRSDAWAEELGALPPARDGVPWLLAGDFNAPLDHAALRDVLGRGYHDAGDLTGNGLIPTWPNDRAYPPLITIDHVLADRRIGISGYGVEDLPGSDHRSIYARLFLPGPR
jgi:endonuclease/exonuclease/phosphatase (EEP) superfamily protein YafD